MAYPTATPIAMIGAVVHNRTRTNHRGRDWRSPDRLLTLCVSAAGGHSQTLAQVACLPPEWQQGSAVHRPLQTPRVNDPSHRNHDGAAEDHVGAAVVREANHDRAGDEGAHASREVAQAEPPPDNPDDKDHDQSEPSHDPDDRRRRPTMRRPVGGTFPNSGPSCSTA